MPESNFRPEGELRRRLEGRRIAPPLQLRHASGRNRKRLFQSERERSLSGKRDMLLSGSGCAGGSGCGPRASANQRAGRAAGYGAQSGSQP